MRVRGPACLLACIVSLAGCGGTASEDIRIPPGMAWDGGGSTLNGDVLVGEGATAAAVDLRSINGDIRVRAGAQVNACTTIHGRIRIDEGATTGALETVNGDLEVGERARVGGGISLVNGHVHVRADALVEGSIGTVNGEIALAGTTVTGDVVNYNGGITLNTGTEVRGDLVVRATPGRLGASVPQVVIGPDSRVLGRLVFERPVRLYVHETAVVPSLPDLEPVRFSSALPVVTQRR